MMVTSVMIADWCMGGESLAPPTGDTPAGYVP